jgi:hypothetical protein
MPPIPIPFPFPPVEDKKNGLALIASEVDSAPSPPKQRPRDLLFEALCLIASIDWQELTPTGRGKINKAVAELRPTPLALAGQWAQCATPPRVTKETVRSLAREVEQRMRRAELLGMGPIGGKT